MSIEATGTTSAAKPWVPSDGDFGTRLALIRHRMGWNVKEAARECGVPAATWRGWEEDGSLPRSLITIAMTIASKTGCDYLWLVHGPGRGGAGDLPHGLTRVIAQVGNQLARPKARPRRNVQSTSLTRPVAQTRPAARLTRPHTPIPA